jgi:hypothetical protein
MNWYVETVKAYPIITAMIQFAILGTLGDMISKWVIQKRIFLPFTYKTLILKMLEWAFLAVCIKYAFVGFNYFVQGLVEKNLLPELNYFWEAFAISLSMNLQFGPFLVIMHRLLDNLIAKEKNWANLDKGMYSLLWFWLPAHTITFMLPKPFQIGLAALWSVVLGLILGYYNSKKK